MLSRYRQLVAEAAARCGPPSPPLPCAPFFAAVGLGTADTTSSRLPDTLANRQSIPAPQSLSGVRAFVASPSPSPPASTGTARPPAASDAIFRLKPATTTLDPPFRSCAAAINPTLPTALFTRHYASLPHPVAPKATVVGQSSADDGRHARPNPFSLVREEIDSVSERLRRCILSEIPTLERAAEYFFRAGAEGKRLRSTIILLMSTTLASSPTSVGYLTVDDSPPDEHPIELRRRQQRIAEITELIHVASLLHDDVIDGADTRRGLRALNSLFGNKVAILAGDFLLARASVSLASLRNPEVIALMSQVLEHLVAGEILQMTATPDESLSMEHYLKKTFYKTASLMANSCKSVAVLAGCDADHAMAAWDYGRHLGIAFQLVDDVLDYTGTSEELGKPAASDVRAGLATAPLLFAAQQRPELVPLIRRKFRKDEDVEMALVAVHESDGVQRARELAAKHATAAMNALRRLPNPNGDAAVECRKALEDIAHKVLTRRK